LASFAFATGVAFAATGGSDNTQGAAYGDGFQTGDDNVGDGFTAWSITTFGGGGFGLADSAAQGFGDINTGGTAFRFTGRNSTGGYDGIDAIRNFEGGSLNAGEAFSIDLAVAFRNGNKGIDIRDEFGATMWNLNVGSDLYSASFQGDLGWSYSQTSIINVRVDQQVGGYQVSLVRGADTFDSGFIASTNFVSGFKLYIGETDDVDNNLNALFANNMAVVIPEPSTIVLGIVGAIGLAIARRRMK